MSNFEEIERGHFSGSGVFSSLFHDKTFTDVSVAARPKDREDQPLEIRCHRVVLAAVSKVLREKFERNEGNPIIYIDYMSHNTLMSIVEFIYKGRVRVQQRDFDAFFAGMRSLLIKFNDSIDKRIYGDQESTTGSSTSYSLKRGVKYFINIKKCGNKNSIFSWYDRLNKIRIARCQTIKTTILYQAIRLEEM